MNEALTITEKTGEVHFGVGGVGVPVVRVDYDGGDVGDAGATFTFLVNASPENGVGESVSYKVIVTLEQSEPVTINLHYTGVGTDSGSSYTLSVDTREDGFIILSWSTGAGTGIEAPFGTRISNHQGSYAVMWTEGSEQNVQYCHTLQDALQALIDNIQPVRLNEQGDEMFHYSQFFSGWYTDAGMKNQYNLGSPVTQDINLYAKFGVTVTFDFGNNEPDHDMVLPAGTTLNDNQIYNYFEGEFVEGKFWVYKFDAEGNVVYDGDAPVRDHIVDGASVIGLDYFTGDLEYEGHSLSIMGWTPDPDSDTKYRFNQQLISNITLYMSWEVEVYELEITFETGTNSNVLGISDVVGVQLDSGSNIVTVNIQYGGTLGLSFFNGFHITDVSGGDGLSISSSDTAVTFVARDAGDNGSTVKVTLTVSDAMDVTLKFAVENGYTSELDGHHIDYQIGVNVGEIDSVGSIVLNDVSRGSKVLFSLNGPYSIYYWVNGVRADSYTIGADVNPTITVYVIKNVSILQFEGLGIDSLQLHKVSIPESLDGGWSHSSTVTTIGTAGSEASENDYFSIQPAAGYYVPDGYAPGNTDTRTIGNGVYFVVNGNGDVSFTQLPQSEQSLVLTITILDSSGLAATDVSNILGWAIMFTFGGQSYSSIVNAPLNNEIIYYNAETTQPVYGCSIEGFYPVSGQTYDGSGTIDIVMKPIGYEIVFHPLETGSQNEPLIQEWDVLDKLSFPSDYYSESGYATADGVPVLVELVGGDQPRRFLDVAVDGHVAVSLSDFDASGVMNLTAVDRFVEVDPPTDSSVHRSLILRVSEVRDGATLDVGVLFDRDVTMTADIGGEVVTIVYDALAMTLHFDGEVSGTGHIVARGGEYTLNLTIIADPEGIA